MKVTVLIENPKEDKKLMESLMERFRELINQCELRPCIIEFDGVNIIITPEKNKKDSKRRKKVA